MVDTAPIARAPLQVPSVDRISTKPVEWIVITPDNVEDVFNQLKADNKSIVVFALSATGYENLSLNIAELTKLIKQQQAINKAYITYYETEQ
jgi:hypothetical protein